jgi:hypothetical protein
VPITLGKLLLREEKVLVSLRSQCALKWSGLVLQRGRSDSRAYKTLVRCGPSSSVRFASAKSFESLDSLSGQRDDVDFVQLSSTTFRAQIREDESKRLA